MPRLNNDFYCSFCGKSQHEVGHLVTGPACGICDECIDLSYMIVHGFYVDSLTGAALAAPWFDPAHPMNAVTDAGR